MAATGHKTRGTWSLSPPPVTWISFDELDDLTSAGPALFRSD